VALDAEARRLIDFDRALGAEGVGEWWWETQGAPE
jgi:hypothetical protein